MGGQVIKLPTGWSADGNLLAFVESHPETGFDVWVLPRDGDAVPVVATENDEFEPAISPDGRLLAYVSTETGQHQVWVTTYPDRQREPVSSSGGAMPIWSKDGRELFYRQGDLMMAVTVTLDPELVVTTPDELFDLALDAKTTGWSTPYYDVAADGRFLAISDRSTTEFKLITNWFEELKQLAPTGGSQ